ncbi:MAG: lytic transglycosylase domain-containing protein [Sphingobacteriaceae bacterium]|nr:lytic transglycosylase domain-containing protein [Sphingobacteriaceae bacterium]
MIKKHLIACSGLLIVMLFAKLFIYSAPESSLNSFSQKVNLPFKFEVKNEPSPEKAKIPALTFSNERLPKGKAIAMKMKKYLRANSYKQIQTTKLHKKAALWFPIIVPILKSYGIPEDFKYMPLVESGLAEGTSPRGAAGFWQFMPGTARNYGLKVNGDVDERKNIRKSTIAACKYLKELHGIFNSWTLAAAAYNIGEVNLLRQMARQGHRNYYKLKLNGETASYVYKIIAMKEIIENPVKHGFVPRSTVLLAKKDDYPKPQPDFINPAIEQGVLKTMTMF